MKTNNSLLIGIIIMIIILTSGLSYAYTSTQIDNKSERSKEIISQLGSIKLFIESNDNPKEFIYNGQMKMERINIEPVSGGKGVYEINIYGELPSALEGKIEISLYKSTDNREITISEGDLSIFYNEEEKRFGLQKNDILNENGLTKTFTKILENGENTLHQEEFNVIYENGALKLIEEDKSYPKYTYYLVYKYIGETESSKSFTSKVEAKLIPEKTQYEENELTPEEETNIEITDVELENENWHKLLKEKER